MFCKYKFSVPNWGSNTKLSPEDITQEIWRQCFFSNDKINIFFSEVKKNLSLKKLYSF